MGLIFLDRIQRQQASNDIHTKTSKEIDKAGTERDIGRWTEGRIEGRTRRKTGETRLKNRQLER